MQNRLKLIFMLFMSFICLFLLSCGEEPDNSAACTSHVDSDHDGKCDECGETLEAEVPPKEPCTICTDLNSDGKCDECGEDVTVTPPPAPACEHKDEDYDGKCDECSEQMQGAISLINLKKTNYNIVFTPGFDGDSILRIKKLSSELKNLGVEMKIYAENDAPSSEYEIIFGEMSSRGEEYFVDSHNFGIKGYAIKVIGNKIVVVAGSSESLITAIDVLKSEIFGINEKTVEIINRVVYPTQSISVVQSDYKVDTITVCGKDIRSYKIAVDKTDGDCKLAAAKLQKLLYEKAGVWLSVVDKSEVSTDLISIELVEKCGEDGFYLTVDGGCMRFVSEYVTSISKEPCDFFSNAIEASTDKSVVIDQSSSFTKNVHFVYYKDFGAVGDGVTNDAEAIIAAHEYAISGSHKKIVAESGKTYYIGKMSKTALITCDVDWTGAKFIIDDSILTKNDAETGRHIFKISGKGGILVKSSDSSYIKAINKAGGVKVGETTKFDLGLGAPALIVVYNSSHKHYIRYGVNASSGSDQQEIILVDEYGNIDPSTPLMFDYDRVDYVRIFPVDDAPITVKGGEFTTKAGLIHLRYFSRGILIERSNLTLDGVEHYIIDEGEKGSVYTAFHEIQYSTNLTFVNCVYTGHKTYKNSKGVGQGTYEFVSHSSANVLWKNCTQTNAFLESGARNTYCWGVMGGGYSKSLVFDGCSLNRFDAHAGVYNASILNSHIAEITVVGGGTFLIENTVVHQTRVISLRDDYGSFWLGDIVIRNVTMLTNNPDSIINADWNNHFFGYSTALPNIIVDGLYIDGNKKSVKVFNSVLLNDAKNIVKESFESTDSATGETVSTPNKNPMAPPQKIEIKNCSEIEIKLPSADLEFFKDTVITVE